jgi:hypothetical protein
MKEPEPLSYFFADHANGRFTASYKPTPGLKNNPKTAPNLVTPPANNTFPLPGAAEHNPPMADATIGSLAGDNHRKQFGREVTGLWGIILTVGKANKPTNKQQNH